MTFNQFLNSTFHAAITGGASALGVSLIDPQTFNIHQLGKLGTVFLAGAIIGVASLWRNPPKA